MSIRYRLDQIVAGAALTEMKLTSLSGSNVVLISGTPSEMMSDMFIAISGHTSGSYALSGASSLYNLNILNRGYSASNPAIYQYGVDLNVSVTDATVKSAVQFGDHAFLLTDATIVGTGFDIGSNYGSDYSENHALVTYVPSTTASQIDLTITNCDASIVTDSQPIFYGNVLLDGTTILYVKDLNFDPTTWSDWKTEYDFVNNTNAALYVAPDSASYMVTGTGFFRNLYEVSGTIKNQVPTFPVYGASNAYMFTLTDGFSGQLVGNFEDGVTNLKVIDAGREAKAYNQGAGTFDALPFSYMLEQSLADSNYVDSSLGVMYVNPFLMKNMYDTNWQTRIDHSNQMLLGLRSYQNAGKSQDMIWASYTFSDSRYVNSNLPWSNFEFVERIDGLYKMQSVGGHKSNIYSININNSGLNERIDDPIMKSKVQAMVEKAVRNAVVRITPSHTQLWKIIWSGV